MIVYLITMRVAVVAGLVLFSLFGKEASAQTEWTHLLNRDGVELFHRDVDGYAYGEFKSVTVLNAPIQSVYSIFQNFATYKEWYGFCIDSDSLHIESPYHKTIFLLVDAPWPIADRYIIADVFFDQLSEQRRLEIRFRLSERDFGISVRGGEPMTQVTGDCILERISENRTRVTFSISLDPGGSVPKKLLQLFLQEQMYRTGTGLKNFSEIYQPVLYQSGK